MPTKMTNLKQRFINAYVIYPNGTEAAREAGYTGDDATLAATASRLLRDDKVLAEIEAKLKAHAMSAAEVLIHLTDIVRGDLADCIDEFGNVDILEAKRRHKTHLIKKYRVKAMTATDESGEHGVDIVESRVEMYDRLRAIDMLAKYHNLVNHIKMDDWRTELLQLLREGKVTWEQVQQELGDGLAQELFESAGVPVLNAGKGNTP